MTANDERRPTIGVVVLQADEIVEDDLRRLFPVEHARVHISRIASGADLTADTIAAMDKALPNAVGLFPEAARFDAIGYACTSGAALIGPARIEALVRQAAIVRHVVDPLSAALAAFSRLGVGRIGLVSPYIAEVSAMLCDALERRGCGIGGCLSFEERQEARVARIDPERIRDAAMRIGSAGNVDCVFLSCTNLRALGMIAEIENEIDKPVVTSTQAFAWRLAGLAGSRMSVGDHGRLMAMK